jgi:O-antigen/teichoic acid export membrane protein
MRRYLSDASYSAVSNVLAAVSYIGLQVSAIRITTAREYGQYAAALAVVIIIEAVFVMPSREFAFQTVGKHWVAREFVAARRAAIANRRLDVIVNSAVYASVVVFAWLLAPRLGLIPWYIAALGLLILAETGFGVSKCMFVAASRLREQAFFESATYLVLIAAGVLGVWLFGIPGLIGATVLATFSKTTIAYLITSHWWPPEVTQLDRHDATSAIYSRVSWWGAANSVARNGFASGTQQADILILSALAGAESTAVYKAAKMVSNAPLLMINPLWAAVRPRLMHALAGSSSGRVQRLIMIPAAIMLTLLLVCIVPLWFVVDQLVLMLFGKEYAAASVPLLLLFVGNWIFGGVTAWYTIWVILEERRLAGTLTLAFLFFAIVAGAWLYHAASPTSMATVVMVSSITAAFLCWGQLYLSLRRMAARELPAASSPEPLISSRDPRASQVR